MYKMSISEMGINLCMHALLSGKDVCVLISGGDGPHIGAVALSVPRGASDKERPYDTALSMPGHKDHIIARRVAERIATELNTTVAVVCGIHIDGMTSEQLDTIKSSVENLTDSILITIKADMRGKEVMKSRQA
jgi:hypothetical protein